MKNYKNGTIKIQSSVFSGGIDLADNELAGAVVLTPGGKWVFTEFPDAKRVGFSWVDIDTPETKRDILKRILQSKL